MQLQRQISLSQFLIVQYFESIDATAFGFNIVDLNLKYTNLSGRLP